ncbi:hypothetical protein MMC29_006265 [Sticta canariensis]|nr:hypothetical protein [Sticta canariensis]
MRIISAAMELAYSRTNENLIDDAERATILDNIVLSLLLLTILQFLIGMYVLFLVFIFYTRRSYQNLIGNPRNESTSPTFLHENYLYFLYVPCLLATILCIAGATYLQHSNPSTGETLVRAGWVIFLLEYLILAQLTIILTHEYPRRYWSEKYVLIAIVVTLPLLIIRFTYALLAEFTDISVFTLLTNWNAIARLCMGIGMEFVMVVFYTATALMQSRVQSWKSGGQILPLRGESLDGRLSSEHF